MFMNSRNLCFIGHVLKEENIGGLLYHKQILLTKVKSPEVGSLLQICHSPEDPHGGIVEHRGVTMSGWRAIHRSTLGHQMPGLTR